MKAMPENSVDSIVTDPPYELGFMGKSWDSSGIAFNIEVWQEALRVLKPGGHLIAFSGSRTYHRMAVAIEDAGFEIRDQIMWVYGSGFPKSMNIGKQLDDWQGWGTALKPAHEPMVLARKPLIGTVANNVLTYGTGGLNIDGSRVPSDDGFEKAWDKPVSTNISAPNGKFITEGSQHTVDLTGNRPVGGRFPANFIHDGSDEVVALFPQSNGGAAPKKSNVPSGKFYEGGWGNVANEERIEFGSGSAARFFYCAKASKRDRNEGLDGFEAKFAPTMSDGIGRKEHNEETATKKLNHHPTVKPTTLMQYLVRLVTPPNGTVLDPFMGSGSTGKAAILEGFDFIGIDQSAEYMAIAEARIEWAQSTLESELF